MFHDDSSYSFTVLLTAEHGYKRRYKTQLIKTTSRQSKVITHDIMVRLV